MLFTAPASSCSQWGWMGRPCGTCVVANPPAGRHGLIWVGGMHYKAPSDFVREAASMGVSRKLSAIPKGFKPGETWVYLAHRQAIRVAMPGAVNEDGTAAVEFQAGIFSVFKPTAIELVIADEHNVPEKAERIVEQYGEEHVNIVRVIPERDAQVSLPMVQEAAS